MLWNGVYHVGIARLMAHVWQLVTGLRRAIDSDVAWFKLAHCLQRLYGLRYRV